MELLENLVIQFVASNIDNKYTFYIKVQVNKKGTIPQYERKSPRSSHKIDEFLFCLYVTASLNTIKSGQVVR